MKTYPDNIHQWIQNLSAIDLIDTNPENYSNDQMAKSLTETDPHSSVYMLQEIK